MEAQAANGKRDWWRVAFMTATIVFLALVLVLVYWLYFDTNPPAVLNEAYVHESVIYAGESYTVHLDWCKEADGLPEVRTLWINDLAFVQPPFYPTGTMFPAGGCSARDIQMQVPSTLPESEYMITYLTTWEVNPVQQRSVEFAVGPVQVMRLDQ
jgi:hypothetical protein